ncbi:brain protein I3-like protein [Leptotrombidium deliense]|uniref:Membrane protein BRI3 n=1 Tax=Leptotrombidium deliense TaxID=299467 RepID=A0A443SMW2_9ACAR|nr:brain protein I3-like protein [Leptotrombidium deliense]
MSSGGGPTGAVPYGESNVEKPPPYSPYPEPNNAYAPTYPMPPPHCGPPYASPAPGAAGVTSGFAQSNWTPAQPYPNYGSTVIIQPEPSPQVIIVGGCPVCRVGVLEEDYTCMGIFLALFFFPIGILCCLALRQRRCPNCGATFD